MSYARRHSTNVCPGNRVRYMCTAPGFLDTRLRYAAWRSSYGSRASSGVRYASFSGLSGFPNAILGLFRVGQDGSQGGGPCVMSSWTAASSDCSRPVNNYVHVKTAVLYRPNARLTPEKV